jgi:hypothetical protein
MAEEKWKSVSRDEFVKFMSKYKPKPVYDVCGIFDPPIGSYNDFSGGKVWPDSVIGYVSLGGASRANTPFEYFISRSLLD